jgi:kinesin family protein 5
MNLNIECTISVSFVEVYGNDILDLLNHGKRCGQSKVSAQRCVLDGNAEVFVDCIDDVLRLLSEGESEKRKAATAMNSRSSRAHSVFIVTLKQKCLDSRKNINSKLFLADLGGCEQTKKSKLDGGTSKYMEALRELSTKKESDPTAELEATRDGAGFVKSDRMREAVYINLGLMSLKSCVEALTRGDHVPYANSKLTMLLASGLGGNSKTSVIVCASQEEQHSTETISAFKFGQSCRQVSNTVRTEEDMLGDLMKELDLEIAACEERIHKHEKWVVQEEKRSDYLAEEGTLGFEVRKTTVLVGAEEDRKHLHTLLLKKAQLSGSDIEESSYSFGGNVGFGKAHEYGLGNKFSLDEEKENYRFSEAPSACFVPKAVKLGTDDSNNIAYMGISA